MITAPPRKQAPIEIRWVAVWILRWVSGPIRECSGVIALSPMGSQTGAATTTTTKTSSRPVPTTGLRRCRCAGQRSDRWAES